MQQPYTTSMRELRHPLLWFRTGRIVRTVKKWSEFVTNRPTGFSACCVAADVSYLTPKVGPYGGIPALWYGPGGGGGHESDEYVDIDDLLAVTKTYALSILDWCGHD